jgi:1-acyl-sn-glycerol-3-phosphate acyltransferase
MAADDRPVPPGGPIHPIRRTIRYWTARAVSAVVVRSYVRPRLVGRARLPAGPAVLCFNHLSWSDPFVLMAVLPMRPRLFFFGPKEEDMAVGGRNRVMGWTGSSIPYKPGKNDLLDATRRVTGVFRAGGVLAIAGEGRIHARESELLPLNGGAAYFALRGGVPIVPVAINGTSWLGFRRRVTVRVGEPIAVTGRPTREALEALTARTWDALHEMLAEVPELDPPGPIGRRVTELFNDWPEGSREATLGATAPASDRAAPEPPSSGPAAGTPGAPAATAAATALD